MAADLDGFVGEWLTVPEVATRIGADAGRVRRLLQDGALLAVRRGEPPVRSVPAAFLVPRAHGADEPDGDEPEWEVLASLHGTLTLLSDAGISEEFALEWLFTEHEELGETPVTALRSGRKTAVRRIAQTLF